MKKTIAIILLIFSIIGCTNSNENKEKTTSKPESHNNEVKVGKSRLEQVTELSYRNLSVGESLKTSLIENAIELKTQLDSANQIAIFYQIGNTTKQDEQNWDGARKAINYSYELWRDKDITMTFVGYLGVSQDAQTGKEIDMYVFEIEHHSLTGKCCVFMDKNNIEFSYFERN